LRGYARFAIIGFRTNLAYRWESIAGTVSYLVSVAMGIELWRALYRNGGDRQILSASELNTYLVLTAGIRAALTMDEFFIEQRVKKGTIAVDMMRPLSFHGMLFAYTIGGALQRLLTQVAPSVVLIAWLYGVQAPPSLAAALFAVLSALLSVVLLFELNLLVWSAALWGHSTWSYVTIKEAMIQLLCGAVVPIWFFPTWLQTVLALTPLDSLVHVPVALYLGKLNGAGALVALAKQAAWAVGAMLLGSLVCRRGLRSAVVYGG